MALTVGIIGLPLSGKTTLFNALTRAGVPITNYPTSTVQANKAIVNVPDERVDRLSAIFVPKKRTYATVEFVDVAGLNSAAPDEQRQELSAEFLGHIRVADALAVVVRTFANASVPGDVGAARDLDDLLTTLTLTDLATVERRAERTAKAAKSGDKKFVAELEVLKRVQAGLGEGTPASDLTFSSTERPVIDELFLLTLKPRLYVANVSETTLAEATPLLATLAAAPVADLDALVAAQAGELRAVAQIGARARREGTVAIAVSAKLEPNPTNSPPRTPPNISMPWGCPCWARIASSRRAIVRWTSSPS